MAAALAVVAARTPSFPGCHRPGCHRVVARTAASTRFATSTDHRASAATWHRPCLGTATSGRWQTLEWDRNDCEPDQDASDDMSSNPHAKKLAHSQKSVYGSRGSVVLYNRLQERGTVAEVSFPAPTQAEVGMGTSTNPECRKSIILSQDKMGKLENLRIGIKMPQTSATRCKLAARRAAK